MSYRMCIENTQLFGNNEDYPEWEEFIKTQDVKFDGDGCYSGYITDVQKMFEVIDAITRRLINEQHEKVLRGDTDYKGDPKKELTDWSNSMYLNENTPILMFNKMIVENAICFMPYIAYKAVEKKIETVRGEHKNTGVSWYIKYKIKPGKKIRVCMS